MHTVEIKSGKHDWTVNITKKYCLSDINGRVIFNISEYFLIASRLVGKYGSIVDWKYIDLWGEREGGREGGREEVSEGRR